MDSTQKPIPVEVSEERLRAMIKHLRPDRELYSGRKFFEKLLEMSGPEGVLAFVEKASEALDKKSSLDLYFDFDPVETDAFRQARLRFMSRREFCGTTAVASAGLVFGITGVTGIARQLKDLANGHTEEPLPTHPIDAVETSVHRHFYPSAEVLIAAALINEAYEKKLEIKLEQIGDAVEELQAKLQKEASKQPRQGR